MVPGEDDTTYWNAAGGAGLGAGVEGVRVREPLANLRITEDRSNVDRSTCSLKQEGTSMSSMLTAADATPACRGVQDVMADLNLSVALERTTCTQEARAAFSRWRTSCGAQNKDCALVLGLVTHKAVASVSQEINVVSLCIDAKHSSRGWPAPKATSKNRTISRKANEISPRDIRLGSIVLGANRRTHGMLPVTKKVFRTAALGKDSQRIRFCHSKTALGSPKNLRSGIDANTAATTEATGGGESFR